MAYEEFWGAQRLVEPEICRNCGEEPCICPQLIDEAEDWDRENEDEA